MSATVNAQTNTNMTAKTTPINEDYEWLQYNEKLKIIHSIKDDMYQMQSIILACNSNKAARHWFDNQSTKDLIAHINACGGIPTDEILYEKRQNLSIDVRGTYIHRKLVNHVAIWASPVYSWFIMNLLDDIFAKQREQLETIIQEKEETIEEQRPRMVPRQKQKSYKYMIWKEECLDDESKVILHLVRRNNKTFYDVAKIAKSDKNWFFRDNLPISMTPNQEIKEIVKDNFTGQEALVMASTIIINKYCLPKLNELLTDYFDNYQK